MSQILLRCLGCLQTANVEGWAAHVKDCPESALNDFDIPLSYATLRNVSLFSFILKFISTRDHMKFVFAENGFLNLAFPTVDVVMHDPALGTTDILISMPVPPVENIRTALFEPSIQLRDFPTVKEMLLTNWTEGKQRVFSAQSSEKVNFCS